MIPHFCTSSSIYAQIDDKNEVLGTLEFVTFYARANGSVKLSNATVLSVTHMEIFAATNNWFNLNLRENAENWVTVNVL